jgi:glycosyltransferase involved in cell wall biosynthesis
VGTPSVSVVLTTFNHGPLILEAISSVLTQSLRPNEIIVVDDGSGDGTGRRLERTFGSAIRYIWQPNAGIAASRNTGVSRASSDLIALMDGDDLWHARKLETQAQAFSRYPESGIVAVRAQPFDGATVPPDLGAPVQDEPKISCRMRLEELLQDNFLPTTSQVAIPKRVFTSVGPSDSRYALCSDFDLYCRIASVHPVTVIDAPLTFWRYHPTSASGPHSLRSLKWGPEMVAVIQAGRVRAGDAQRRMFDEAIRTHVLRLGWHAYRYAVDFEKEPALTVLRGLVSQHPLQPRLWAYLAAGALPRPIVTQIGRWLQQLGVGR